MDKYVSVAEMVAIEQDANASGLSYAQMMEHAGRGLAEVVQDIYQAHQSEGVLGLVGSGNNGGDTLVALALMAGAGWQATAYIVRPRPQDDPLVARLIAAGGKVLQRDADTQLGTLRALLAEHALLLDGVLGTGIRLPLRAAAADVLAMVKRELPALPHLHVVAVDCPSGVDCDSGAAAPEAIPAELTVTMAAYKQGLLCFPAFNLVGELVLVGIGLGEDIPLPAAWQRVSRFVADRDWVAAHLPPRPLDAHKGTFGTLLVAAGSRNYSGAALLAGRAAYLGGAGLVTLAVPESLHCALAGQIPEATWLPLPDEQGAHCGPGAEQLLENLKRVTALLVGPGFGQTQATLEFMKNLFPPHGRELPPVVVDADGLKLLAGLPDWPRRLPGESILTPHPGEMAVLTGLAKDEIQAGRVATAERYARQWGHVVVLKGAFTVIAAPGGETAVIPVATPALARAGTGDVLAGLIAGLRAQGMPAFDAAVAGAWIHAQAGIYAAQDLGTSAAVLAGDVGESIPDVLANLV